MDDVLLQEAVLKAVHVLLIHKVHSKALARLFLDRNSVEIHEEILVGDHEETFLVPVQIAEMAREVFKKCQ